MIIDNLKNSELYSPMHAGIRKVFDFISTNDLTKLELGRTNIEGDDVFALVSKGVATAKSGKMEAHRRYLDLHFVLEGTDKMGYKPTELCKNTDCAYNETDDYMLFNDLPDTYFVLYPGDFAICFPQDTHVPLQGDGAYYKVVFKIKL